MENKSAEELKQIAIDLHHGKIFCDRQIPEGESLTMVFMVLALMKQEQLDELKSNPPGLLYEYVDKAGPRSVNYLPTFLSMRMLSRPDTEKVFGILKQLREAELAVPA